MFLLGVMLFIFLVYCGLNAAERGLQELMALQAPRQALRFTAGEGTLIIVFAGKEYLIPYASCWKGLFGR